MAEWRVALLTGWLACTILGVLPSAAVADRAFTSRSSTNTQGDIAVAANTVLSCVTDEGGCPEARLAAAGATKLNNNDRVMAYVDDDGGGSSPTFNSSEATLTLPDGARVIAAWLYWGGRSAAGTGGKPAPGLSPDLRGRVLLRAPGDVGYSDVVSPFAIDTAGDSEYQARANVTDTVRAAGAGVYRVANVQVGTGKNAAQSGGWALVVVFGHPDEPTRNLSLFDGFQNVSSNSAGVTIPLSGFQTPLSGAVNATVGIVAQEGDRATLGDGATIRGAGNVDVRLGNAANPGGPPQSAANIFNASISRTGTNVTDRSPAHANTFGFDVDTFETTSVLGNNQTSTDVKLTTSGDAYIPGVVFIATELYAPQVAATKTVDKPTANLGEELTYTARFENTGADGAAGFVTTDAIPAGTTYVPGSLAIDGVAQSDVVGDDRAEYDAGGDRVVARLGTGANATGGGTLAIGLASTVTFRARIDDAGFAAGAQISNVARATFTGQTTSGVTYDPVDSAPAVTRLLLPDLVVQKTHSPGYVAGGSATIQIGVFNVGEGPTTGETVVTDTLPAGLVPPLQLPPADPWACAASGQTITCRHPDPLPPGPQPIITIPVSIPSGTPVGSLANTATVTNPSDPNADNNSVTDEGAVSEPQFDLSVDKRVTSTPPLDVPGYFPGGQISYELRVRNDGTQAAPDVRLTDPLPAGLFLDPLNTPATTQGTCTGTTCELGTIAPGQEVIVSLFLVTGVGSDYVSNAAIVNRAEVTGTGTDIDPTNNSAEASVPTLPLADIVVTKEFSPEQPVAGGPITYTVTLRNDGPDMVDIAVGDALPPQILDPTITIAGDTGDCVPFEPLAGTDLRVGSCTIPQFEVGGARTFTITGRLAPDSAGQEVVNLAGTLGLLVDFDYTNNDDFATFIPGTVDVAIEKTRVGSGPVAVGGEATFRLLARNKGDAPGTGIEVRDTMPVGLTPVAADPDCTISGQEVVCHVDELGPDDERAFEVRARAEPSAAGQTLTNRGTVTALAADPEPTDNTSEATVTIANRTASPSPPPVEVETQCRSNRRITIRIREHRARLVRSAQVRLAGRRVLVKRRSDGRLVAVVDLRGLPKGTYRVVITAVLRNGRGVRWVRSYRTCSGVLAPSNRLDHPRSL